MHIPDGFLSNPLNGAAALFSAVTLAFCVTRVKRAFHDKAFAAPLLATLAAFIFAAQMLNFPIGGGTSGHFLGAALAAALLGPWSACLILSVVLVIQGLLFGDGGISALGSNILNMGLVGGIAVYPLMRGLRALLPVGRKGFFAAVAGASWLSVVLASSACAVELALSGTSPLAVAFPAMVGVHSLIGIGEAMISVAVLNAVMVARPDLMPTWARLEKTVTSNTQKRPLIAGLVLAAALALFSPFASSAPDGLEKVAEAKGFMQTAQDQIVWANALFPDYKIPALSSEKVSTSLAGLIGTMVAFGFGFGVIRLMIKPRKTDAA